MATGREQLEKPGSGAMDRAQRGAGRGKGGEAGEQVTEPTGLRLGVSQERPQAKVTPEELLRPSWKIFETPAHLRETAEAEDPCVTWGRPWGACGSPSCC